MIEATLVGGEEVIARFAAMPGRLRQELAAGIGRAVLLVQVRSKEKLSDEVLHVRTGRLRRSVNTQVTQAGDRVTGIVGTNVAYAAAHEYGFQGVVSVAESLRRTKLGNTATVRAHDRHMNLPERSFLRSALRELQPEIRDEISLSADRAVGS